MPKCNSIYFGIMIAVFMGNGLTGCVTMTPEQQAQLQRDAAVQITCTKGDDCDEKWSRAVAWVSQTSSYKIQMQTESLIQTFTATGGTPSSGFLVNKVALGKGTYQISMSSACDNVFGCIPDAQTLRGSFNRFVGGVQSTQGQFPVATLAAAPSVTTARVSLGVQFTPVTSPFANTIKMGEPRGLMVVNVAEKSVAAITGIQQGDVILTYGDKVMTGNSDLQNAVAETAAGSAVRITIWRQGIESVVTAQF